MCGLFTDFDNKSGCHSVSLKAAAWRFDARPPNSGKPASPTRFDYPIATNKEGHTR